ncbi:UDP-N-acetylmuramoyl-tripeptide--D-alanyl-D-alanine ligase [Luteibaculum oceani]|nr:UDP-N-acetylmuramoyl-tripeptide--D-alanyl-D-alanine ligase [Luteibaculum oceani]
MISKVYNLFLQSNGVSTDTRDDLTNKIFFALKGPNFNGNKFAAKALEQGAIAAVIDEPEYATSDKTFLVSDVLTFLQELATHHRIQLNPKVIALTGSNGKTTTKELLFSVLKQNFSVQCTKGNLNNHIGVPLTLLSCRAETEILIVEMGANHPKEIELLASIAKPLHGLITNIGKAHLEGFGSIEGVDRSKRELFDFINNQPEGFCFINNNDPFLAKAKNNYQRIILYGAESNYKFSPIENENPMLTGALNIDGQKIEVETQLIGEYNSDNVLAAATIGAYLGMDLRTIKKGLESYQPENSRSQLAQGKRNKLFLDAYNANPTSVSHAIRSFAKFKGEKLAIIGAMKEGGENSSKEHEEIADLLSSLEIPHFLIGAEFNGISNPKTLGYYPTWKALVEGENNLNDFSGKNILIKGSRSVGLENLVPHL